MLLFAFLLLTQDRTAQSISDLDALAKARDVPGLTKYLASKEGRNPFSPIATGGAYGTGRYGWRAILLRMLGQSFVVFTTALTSEDVGELLFIIKPDGKLEYIPEDFDNGQQIASHDFDVRFDLAGKKAIIKDTIALQIIGQQFYAPMVRMGPNYRVSRITDGQGRDVAFLQAGGIVCFPGLRSNERLTLSYTGTVDKPQFAGSISDKEAMLTNDYWYPMVARKPAPYRLAVTVPRGWIPVGQGEPEGETIVGGMRKASFRMDVPVTYYSLSAAPYGHAASETKGKRYQVWSNELSEAQMRLQNELYPSIIQFYEQFAKYPFSSWGAVVSRAYGGGALEAYSFATYGGGVPGDDAHETAHTWWGGMISNTYLRSMWNESFADFCDAFYRRNVPIGNVAERRLAFIDTPSIQDAYNAAPVGTASPFIGPAATAIGYGKGSYVLQMLEQEIGTDRMVRSMQNWQVVQPKNRGGEWEDFEAAVDRIMGDDEHWFFDQWVRRPGWADFRIENLKWANGRLTGSVVFEGDPYVLHPEVLIRDQSGKDTTATAPISSNVRDKVQRFVIPCPSRPSLVSFDPWRRILRPIHADESPVELRGILAGAKRYTDPAHPEYLKGAYAGRKLDSLPADLAGTFIVGHPATLPALKALCDKVGFHVGGETLTWKGTSVDLTKGAALAVVDLGNGKRCVIGLGQTRYRPNFGRAKTVLVDDLGRFLRGETLPKTSGYLTFSGF